MLRAEEVTPRRSASRSETLGASLTPRRWAQALTPVLVVAALLLFLAWQSPRPVTIDIEGTDFVSRADWWPPEVGPQSMYRWSQARSTLIFPDIGAGNWHLTLELATRRPAGAQSPIVTLTTPGNETLAVLTPTVQFGSYTVGPALQSPLAGALTLYLATNPTFSTQDDRRELGIALDSAKLAPAGLVVPSPVALLELLGALAALMVTLGTLAGLWVAVAAGGLSTLVLAAALAWNRLWVTPFAGHMLLGSLGLGVVALGLRWVLIRRIFAAGETSWRAQWPRRQALVVVVALVLSAAALGAGLAFVADHPRAADFRDRYDSATAYNAGAPLYDLAGLRADAFRNLYKYPPLFAGTLRPLALLDYDSARDIWRVILMLALLAGVAVLVWTFTVRPFGGSGVAATRGTGWRRWLGPATLLLLVCAAAFRPAIDSLNYGQPDPVILLLLALTLAALRAGRPGWAGVPLALAAALKIYPGLLVIYLIWRRDWRAVAGFFLAFVGWNVVAAILTSPNDVVVYWTQVFPLSGGSSAYPENQTWSAFWARLLTDRLIQEEFPRTLALRWWILTLLTYAGALAAFVATLWSDRYSRRGSRADVSYSLGFGAVTCLSVCMLPVAWIHYLTALLLPLAVAFYAWQSVGPRLWAAAPRTMIGSIVLVVLGAALLAYENIWLVFEKVNPGELWKLVLSYKFYGAAALWVGLLLLQRADRLSTISEATTAQQMEAPAASRA